MHCQFRLTQNASVEQSSPQGASHHWTGHTVSSILQLALEWSLVITMGIFPKKPTIDTPYQVWNQDFMPTAPLTEGVGLISDTQFKLGQEEYLDWCLALSPLLSWMLGQLESISTDIAQSMMCVISRIHNGLKVVFCFRHATPSYYHHDAWLLTCIEHKKILVEYILLRVCLRWSSFFLQYMGLHVFNLSIWA